MTTETTPQGLEKTEYKELVVGDHVVISPENNSGQPMKIVKILRITPSRQFALEDGTRFNLYGREIGADEWHSRYIFPLGFQRTWSGNNGEKPTYYQLAMRSIAIHADFKRRVQLTSLIMQIADGTFHNLRVDQLERILEIVKEESNGNQK